jgi:hypothetical protein
MRAGKAIVENTRIAARSDRQSPKRGTRPTKYQFLHITYLAKRSDTSLNITMTLLG